MPSTKFKKRDLNRYRKIYPYVRKQPKFAQVSDKKVVIEIGELVYTNSASETYTFVETYSSEPVVGAISYDSEGNNSANVNVYISTLTTTSVTIKTSQNFTGKIHFQIIWVES